MQVKGKKFDGIDAGKLEHIKPMWHLLPFKEIEEVVKVLTFGMCKYGEDDWKHFVNKPGNEKRYLSAALRHISSWSQGETCDAETKKHHLAHAICCLLFVFWKDNKSHDNK